FFFQAEDGIRDFHVTGVQTCALPIYASHRPQGSPAARSGHNNPAANTNAAVVFPTPRGPVNRYAWAARPLASVPRSILTAAAWPRTLSQLTAVNLLLGF